MVARKSKKIEQLLKLQEELVQIQQDGSGVYSPIANEMPLLDMYFIEDELYIKIYLPEFNKDEIELGSGDHILDIRAEKSPHQNDDKERKYLIKESRSVYNRKIGLPDGVQLKNVSASYESNILILKMPYKQNLLQKIQIS